jgi:Arc/MetJ-type ribon-helix-helix transcriptional regulator
MTIQIAIGLPDDLVAYIDSHVAAGDATSRSDMVRRALERERHREPRCATLRYMPNTAISTQNSTRG